jgi:hypothetical protein
LRSVRLGAGPGVLLSPKLVYLKKKKNIHRTLTLPATHAAGHMHGRSAGHRRARRSHAPNHIPCRADTAMGAGCWQVASSPMGLHFPRGGVHQRQGRKGNLLIFSHAAAVELLLPLAALPLWLAPTSSRDCGAPSSSAALLGRAVAAPSARSRALGSPREWGGRWCTCGARIGRTGALTA